MLPIYDTVVVGAGVAGAAVAYHLKKMGHNVAVLDQAPLCSGASGAAGAFVSPMIGKPNPLKSFTNGAFSYAVTLYKEVAGDEFIQNGVLRLAKEDEEQGHFEELEEFIELPYEKRDEGYFFPEGGLIPPETLMTALLKGCDCHFRYQVEALEQDSEGCWLFNGFKAKNVVLATGAYVPLVKFPFKFLRAVWGERIRIETDTRTTHNYHKKVSVSTTVNGNQLLIGATHKKNHDWFIDENTEAELLKSAEDILPIKNPKVIEIKAGMRPGSVDYYPIVGAVPDIEANIRDFESIRHGTKVPPEKLHYKQGLYIHTGHGGRGFVTAPESARMLAEKIVNGTPVPENLDLVRYFYRWMRRDYKPGADIPS